MFRRQTDFSWPLILVLVGLFFLSLRLPRQWERIARPTALVLKPHKLAPAKELPSVSASRPAVSPMEVFRSIKPADHVANHADAAANSTPSANYAMQSAVVASVMVAKSPMPEVFPTAVPVEEPVEVGFTVKESRDGLTATEAVPTRSTSPHPTLPPPQVKAKNVATAAPERTEELRVLRVVSASVTGPSLGSEEKSPAEVEVRRLPLPESGVIQTQPSLHSSTVSDVVRQPQLSVAIPEPSATVEPSPAIAQTIPNPVRRVIPEPQPLAAENSPSASLQPAVSQPNTIMADNAKPANRAGATPPLGSESAIAEPPMKAIGRAWEEPKDLLAQFEELEKHEITRAWATEASVTVRKLGPAISVGAVESREILQHLDQLAGAARSLVTKVADETLAENLSRTSHALERRITVWKQIGQMGGMVAANAPTPAVDPQSFNRCLREIDQLTNDSSEGHAWRKYLLIESLHDWAARRRNNDERVPGDLAQQVLKRLNQMSVTSHQRQFLTSGPMASLHREMLRHTAEPVESNRLLRHLENYERSRLPSDAQLLARDCQFLAVGSEVAQRELGERIETQYRNANLRIAVTAELLNRMMPKRDPEYAPVQDTILGVPVRGQSLMANDITVRMIPDPQHVRMALEVNGEMAALTRSTAGPATFYSDSESSYIARKPLEISLRGIRTWPAEVAVDNSSKLREIRTDFDRVPLFGQVARRVAESQHDQKMPAADAEVRGKIAAKAKERVDRETTEQIAAAAKRLHEEVLGPMDSLLLDPMMVAAETTDKRFSMRIRLAGPDQLGGHTPRPQAPADCLASIQIHESMLNNVLERLELDGQTFDLAGLGQRLAERLHRFQPKPVDPDQEDVKITFAAKDAIHVRCNDDRVEITLAISRLNKGTRKWKDFQVRAFYRPVVQGRCVDLARDGIVQLIGPRLNAVAQVALRGVFIKVFSQKEPIHATPESFVKNPKLDGVVVTQLVIDDGWIGAAIGPQRTAAMRTLTTR
ncbi:MAG: hypothetical protein ACLP9L_35940 [Thermoguttaceae bacterium]